MKKLILILTMVFGSLTLIAQNQFRDYTDFKRAEWEKNKPQVEHKDGKVIITMTEGQFERMKQMRKQNHFRPASFHPMDRPPLICEKCKHRIEIKNKRRKR